jgi:catechol 2,3-dioxygenase-like lactoylglutathione lyase family enzyme
MKIEHVGYTVQDPLEVADWYCRHLGFRVARGMQTSPFTTFLVDQGGGMLEIYNNPAVQPPDYRAMDPLLFHIAFSTGEETIETVRDRLLAAGASLYSDLVVTPAGDQLVMLQDPWGLAIQLARRNKPIM